MVGHGFMSPRYLSQGQYSAHLLHPADEVDALDARSLMQQRRQGQAGAAQFPVLPWDGTMRDIAATDIGEAIWEAACVCFHAAPCPLAGLWRDPGWDLHPPKGDTKKEMRGSALTLPRNTPGSP